MPLSAFGEYRSQRKKFLWVSEMELPIDSEMKSYLAAQDQINLGWVGLNNVKQTEFFNQVRSTCTCETENLNVLLGENR